MKSRSRVNGRGTRFGMYLPTSSAGSASRGMTRSSERRKSATPTRSTERVERHVDAGHQDERPLAAGDLATPLDLFLERLQPADRARDRVLRTAQVEVDDLQELACALGDLGDEVGDVVVVEVDLRRADGGQPVVGPAVLVARHDVVHLASRGGTPPPAAPRAGTRRDTQASAVYSPTEWPQAIAPSTNAPCSRISATWAAATVAIATWVNCVRYSTPSGCW